MILGISYFDIFCIIIIIMLLFLLVSGERANGVKSWINFGPISIQPSEFAKLAIIIIVAKKIEDMNGKIDSFKKLFVIFHSYISL